jgi:cytochrome c biogenesis protein CcdA
VIAALVAIVAGLINVKDFFWFKQGVSLSIPDGARPKLYERTRDLLKAHSLYALVPATIALALFANLYEFLCTAGFPMIYTRILTLSDLSNLQYYLYLILYNVIYVLPMLAIVLVFSVSLGGRKLQEREGRNMKLISGMMMLALGLILLINPNLLHQVGVTLLIIALAISIGVILILVQGRVTNNR